MFFLRVSKVFSLVSLVLFIGLISCKDDPLGPEKTPAAPAGMKLIASGTFTMGSETGLLNEKPAHQVTVSSFYIDSTEVTQKEYLALMGKNPSKNKDPEPANTMRLPVENVTWFDAVMFCNARSKALGKDTVYSYTQITIFDAGVDTFVKNLVGYSADLSKNGFRLPTESEWEYACRAGTTTDFVSGYNDSTNLGLYAWHSGNSRSSHMVATKQPNAWGLYDMIGNVWEWCTNALYTYTAESQTDPQGPLTGDFRMQRGGMYTIVSGGYSATDALRSSARETKYPDSRSNDRGFRCVCSAK